MSAESVRVSTESARVDPRVLRTRRAVLDAALAELAARGYGSFTIDAVAARAGVARSTIYRIWTDRATLIADAIDALNQQPPPRPEPVETPRERIVVLLHHLAEAMRSSPVAACLPALIDGAERDPAIRRLHHGYNDRRRAALIDAVAAAITAGQTHPDVDPDLAATALAGTIVYRRLMTANRLSSSEVEPLLNTVLGPPTPTAS